jgi:glc operon protein GlcG
MTMLKTLASAWVFALLAVLPAQSQTAPPPYGPPITLEAAKKVMAAAEADAIKNEWSMAIAIIDSGGHVVMLHRMDNTQLSSVELSTGKARSALYFKIPSKLLDEAISGGGAGLRFLALRDIVPLDGGLPIVVDGKIVGAIGVSGMRSANNAQVAQAGVDALK